MRLSPCGFRKELTCSRSLGPYSRPRTPPTPSNRSSPTPPPTAAVRGQSPNRQPYASYVSQSSTDWNDDNNAEDQEEEDDFMYDDDEDEFGLPSLASMRRKRSKKAKMDSGQSLDPPGQTTSRGQAPLSNFAPRQAPARGRANSTDIGDERGAPTYPSAKKSEGKILRPQYKDILRGSSQT